MLSPRAISSTVAVRDQGDGSSTPRIKRRQMYARRLPMITRKAPKKIRALASRDMARMIPGRRAAGPDVETVRVGKPRHCRDDRGYSAWCAAGLAFKSTTLQRRSASRCA